MAIETHEKDDDVCRWCKDGGNQRKCDHCDDSHCGACHLWFPSNKPQGACDGSCIGENYSVVVN